jgi:hypothetical protein
MKVDECGTQNLYIFCGGAFHRREKNGKKIFLATPIVFLFLLLKLKNGIVMQEIL